MFINIALAQGLKQAGGIVKGIAEESGAATYSLPQELIGTGINAALAMVGLIFLILMIYAGYLWLTSHGEEEPIKKAQKIIASSVIGFILVASAYAITVFVGKRFEVGGGGTTENGTQTPMGEEVVGDPNLQVCCVICKEKLLGEWYDHPEDFSGVMSQAACLHGCTGEDADECAIDTIQKSGNEITDSGSCQTEKLNYNCEQYEK